MLIKSVLLEEIKVLEEKQDNCLITKDEERRLEYLKWQYANPITPWQNPVRGI